MTKPNPQQQEQSQAQASNLTQDPARTNMVAAPVANTVRIQAKTHIRISETLTLAPGQEAEVSEDLAKEFCDRKFKGNYAFSGERDLRDATRHIIQRAVRL